MTETIREAVDSTWEELPDPTLTKEPITEEPWEVPTSYIYPQDMEIPIFNEFKQVYNEDFIDKAFWASSVLSTDFETINQNYDKVLDDFNLFGRSDLYDNAVKDWVEKQEPMNKELVAEYLESDDLSYDIKRSLIDLYSKGALTSVNLKDAFEEKMIEDRVFKTETDFLDNRREDINKRIEESKEINFNKEKWDILLPILKLQMKYLKRLDPAAVLSKESDKEMQGEVLGVAEAIFMGYKGLQQIGGWIGTMITNKFAPHTDLLTAINDETEGTLSSKESWNHMANQFLRPEPTAENYNWLLGTWSALDEPFDPAADAGIYQKSLWLSVEHIADNLGIDLKDSTGVLLFDTLGEAIDLLAKGSAETVGGNYETWTGIYGVGLLGYSWYRTKFKPPVTDLSVLQDVFHKDRVIAGGYWPFEIKKVDGKVLYEDPISKVWKTKEEILKDVADWKKREEKVAVIIDTEGNTWIKGKDYIWDRETGNYIWIKKDPPPGASGWAFDIDKKHWVWTKSDTPETMPTVILSPEIKTNTTPIGINPGSRFLELYNKDPVLTMKIVEQARNNPAKFEEAFGVPFEAIILNKILPQVTDYALNPDELKTNIDQKRNSPETYDYNDYLKNPNKDILDINFEEFIIKHLIDDTLFDKPEILMSMAVNSQLFESIVGTVNQSKSAVYFYENIDGEFRLNTDEYFQLNKDTPFPDKTSALEAALKIKEVEARYNIEPSRIQLINQETQIKTDLKFQNQIDLLDDNVPFLVQRTQDIKVPNTVSQDIFQSLGPVDFKILGTTDIYNTLPATWITHIFTQGRFNPAFERIINNQDLYKGYENERFFTPVLKQFKSLTNDNKHHWLVLVNAKHQGGINEVSYDQLRQSFPALDETELIALKKMDETWVRYNDHLYTIHNQNERTNLTKNGYTKSLTINGQKTKYFIKEDIAATLEANLAYDPVNDIYYFWDDTYKDNLLTKAPNGKVFDKDGNQFVRFSKGHRVFKDQEIEIINMGTGLVEKIKIETPYQIDHGVLSKDSAVSIDPLPYTVFDKAPGHLGIVYQGQKWRVVVYPKKQNTNGKETELKFKQVGKKKVIDSKESEVIIRGVFAETVGLYHTISQAQKAADRMNGKIEGLDNPDFYYSVEKTSEAVGNLVQESSNLHTQELHARRSLNLDVEESMILNPLSSALKIQQAALDSYISKGHMDPLKQLVMEEFGDLFISQNADGIPVFPRNEKDMIAAPKDVGDTLRRWKIAYNLVQSVNRMESMAPGWSARFIEDTWRMLADISESIPSTLFKDTFARRLRDIADTSAMQANTFRATTSLLFITMQMPFKHWMLQGMPFWEMLITPSAKGARSWKALNRVMPVLLTWATMKNAKYAPQHRIFTEILESKEFSFGEVKPQEVTAFNKALSIMFRGIKQMPELAGIPKTAAALNQFELDLGSGKFTPKQMIKKSIDLWKTAGFVSGEMLNKTGWFLILVEDWKANNPGKEWYSGTYKYTDEAGITVRETADMRLDRLIDEAQRMTHNMTRFGTPEYMNYRLMPTLAQFMVIMQKLAVEPVQTNFNKVKGKEKAARMGARYALFGAAGLYYGIQMIWDHIFDQMLDKYPDDNRKLTAEQISEISNIKYWKNTIDSVPAFSDIMSTFLVRELYGAYDPTIHDEFLDYKRTEDLVQIAQWYTPFGLKRDQIWLIPLAQGLLSGVTDDKMFTHASANANSRIIRLIKDMKHFMQNKDLATMTEQDQQLFWTSIARLSSGGNNYFKTQTCLGLWKANGKGDFETGLGYRQGLELSKTQCLGKILGGTSTAEDVNRRLMELDKGDRKDVKKMTAEMTNFLINYEKDFLINIGNKDVLQVKIELENILQGSFAALKANGWGDDEIEKVKQNLILNGGKIWDSRNNPEKTVLFRLIEKLLIDEFVHNMGKSEEEANELVESLGENWAKDFIYQTIRAKSSMSHTIRDSIKATNASQKALGFDTLDTNYNYEESLEEYKENE